MPHKQTDTESDLSTQNEDSKQEVHLSMGYRHWSDPHAGNSPEPSEGFLINPKDLPKFPGEDD